MRRRSMNRWLGGLALIGALAAGCARQYEVAEEPSVPLSRFGSVSLGDFSTGEFLSGVKARPRYGHTQMVVSEANRAVYRAVLARLKELRGAGGGPPLLLTANLDDFEMDRGQGLIQYHVNLSSAGQPVASYDVRRRIMGGTKGAYEAEGDDIARFLIDHQ
jgi:hypothetical protein